ncbi:MAG: DUF1489 family protein [Alphaproteobacteria bacterium]|nr:DUF1489 family protein [Alphaproteobacteria bacterium]
MSLHLLKLCVGVAEVGELARWQRRRFRAARRADAAAILRHYTRQHPRRAAEIVAGGSLYWVIRGAVRVRQSVVAIETVANHPEGKTCAFVLDPTLVLTLPQPRRPHQGWRYLDPADAPPDLAIANGGGLAALPSHLLAELTALGLL